jgi:predicted patatin/cPLA2 family phospholipase
VSKQLPAVIRRLVERREHLRRSGSAVGGVATGASAEAGAGPGVGASAEAGASADAGAARDSARRFADDRRIALVVQGGAMRGVFTAGCLCALEDLGLRDCFDVIYGSSGGAINSAYLLAGQVYYGTSIYYSDINNRSFIDFGRLLAGTAVDMDYCFDEVIGRRKRLDLERVIASQTPLHIICTDVGSLRPHAFAQQQIASPAELLAILKASAAMPFVYRRRLEIRGRRYVDGAFLEPVPLQRALDDGATDVLTLLSKPFHVGPSTMPPWMRPLTFNSINRRERVALEAAWEEGLARHQRALDLLQDGSPEASGDGDGRVADLHGVAPPDDFQVKRWTVDRALLTGAAIEGAMRVYEAFGVPREELEPHEAIRLRSSLISPGGDRRNA